MNATVVLVHGAWADGSSWQMSFCHCEQKVIKSNGGRRFRSRRLRMTMLLSNARWREPAGRQSWWDMRMRGAVIAGATGWKSLVYVAARAPAEGETVADVFYRAKPHPEAPQLEP